MQWEYLNVRGKPSQRKRQRDKRGKNHEFPMSESVKIGQSMSALMMAIINDTSLKAVYKWTVPLYLIDYAILAKDKVKQAEKDAAREFPQNLDLRGLSTWARLSMLPGAKTFRRETAKVAQEAEDVYRMERANLGSLLGTCKEMLEEGTVTDQMRDTILSLGTKEAQAIIKLYDLAKVMHVIERREALMTILAHGLKLAKEDADDSGPLSLLQNVYATNVAEGRPAAPASPSQRPAAPSIPATTLGKPLSKSPKPRADPMSPLPAIPEHAAKAMPAKTVGVPTGRAVPGTPPGMPPAKAGNPAPRTAQASAAVEKYHRNREARHVKLPQDYHKMKGPNLVTNETAQYTHDPTSWANAFYDHAKSGTNDANMDIITKLRVLVWHQTKVIIDNSVEGRTNPHCMAMFLTENPVAEIYVFDKDVRNDRT
jgi:hypothetical protein